MRRAIILVAASLAACRPHDPPPPAPAPMFDEAPMPPPPSLPPPAEIRLCVVRDAALTEVSALYSETTGDTMVAGHSFSDVFPVTEAFARNAGWYINNEPIAYRMHRYVKYGLPRVLKPGDVVRDGDFRGVPVFMERGATSDEVIYVPVLPLCEFQP